MRKIDKKMKIALFHNLPSGGAKRALYNSIKYLAQTGHLVDVFVPSTANENYLPLRDFANKLHVFSVKRTMKGLIHSTFQYIPPIKRISLFDLEKTEEEIANFINRLDYDVVLCEQDQYTMSPFFLKFIKKPVVYYCQQPLRSRETILQNISQIGNQKNHSKLLKRMWHKYLNKKSIEIDKKNASFSKYILANSYFSRESILRSYGLNSYVSYLGVDTELFKPLKVSKENFVLSVGSCTPNKGFEFIIRSLSHISSKIRPKFIIVSNSSYKGWEEYLEQLAIENSVALEIKKLVHDNVLVSLYNKARLLVYAPYLEPFGLVPLEAMACGTPVVAVKEGGIRESVIQGETGVLTERDEIMFAEAVTELLLDKEESSRMALQAVKAINDFWTLEHAGERLEKHLVRATENKYSLLV